MTSISNPRIIDLTHPLSPSTTPRTIYPGDPDFQLTPHATISKDGYSVHNLSMGTQSGTHIDAPCHFVEGGRSIDQIGLDELVGRACIVDFTRGGCVRPGRRQKLDWGDLENAWKGTSSSTTLEGHLRSSDYKIFIVNTGWSEQALASDPFDQSTFFAHPYFSSSVATRLLDIGIKVFGTDVPNPDETPFQKAGAEGQDASEGKSGELEGGSDGYAFHEVFLGGGGLIVENMANLRALEDRNGGEWVVNVIPLKLEGTDGSPVRVFAYRQAEVG
ncbi:cyclase [Coprinopsis cinerea AmutBmut pab1-1]|nr:cyclase [Coprinopsis cinerea AmutBmut pab1-1]